MLHVNFYERPYPRKTRQKSIKSFCDVVFNEKASNGSHKKPIKLVTLVKLALPSPPYGNSDMKSSDKKQ